jgi:cytochrome P450
MLPAGPTTPPFVNMVRWVRTPLPMLEDLHARYGTRFTMRLPRMQGPMVFFAEPAAVKDIWTGDPQTLHAGQANVILKAVLGEHSLLLLDGDRHLRERRLMLPPFHGERMRAYGLAMRDATLRAIADWPTDRAFPVHATMQDITLDVIMRTIYGVGDRGQLAALRDALVRWTTLGTSKLGTALLLLTPIEYAAHIRELATRPLGRFLPWAPLVRAQHDVDTLLRATIAARRREGTEGREDVLSMLIDARDEHGAGLTDDQLRDEMLTLLVAGHETTATTLAWALHHLTEHPQWLARVHAELAEVVGSGDVQPEHAERLPILDAVIKETLRLTPIIPMVGRVLSKPATIGGIDLPAGAAVLACIYLVHRREDLWPNAARFDPDRFVGKKIDPTTYFPFGGGVRRCLGMAFASYEMKIVLATILARMTIGKAPGKPIRLVRRGITFAPSGGMPVVARPLRM